MHTERNKEIKTGTQNENAKETIKINIYRNTEIIKWRKAETNTEKENRNT